MDHAKINAEMLEFAELGNLSALKSLPKSDLHAHMMLSAPFEEFKRIANKPIPSPPKIFESFAKFDEYLFTHLVPHLNSIESTTLVLSSALKHMAADGICVAEVSFDVSIAPRLKLPWGKVAELFQKIITQFSSQIVIRPELGISRGTLLKDWQLYTAEAIESGFLKGSIFTATKIPARLKIF